MIRLCSNKILLTCTDPPDVMLFVMFSVQTGKPGSVCDDHLSRRNISKTFKPSPEVRGPRLPLHDVAPDGVYKADMSPHRR